MVTWMLFELNMQQKAMKKQKQNQKQDFNKGEI